MIKIENLVKEFSIDNKKFRAVDNVNLSINQGEIFGIIGLSGAGKSTLIRLINRLEEPTEGRVIIDGININTLTKKELNLTRQNIGMIFQSFNLFNQQTVYDNIAYPLRLQNKSKKEIDKLVMEQLEFVNLVEKKNAYPKELSGGQKQRVAIARAIVTKPKILLSDESTSALDPQTTKQILDLLKKAVDVYKMTVVMITHQLEVAKEICDKVAVMENGKIIEQNTVTEIFKNPKTSLAKNLIKSIGNGFEEEIDVKSYSGKIFRLSYDETSSNEPILSRAIKNFDIEVNIISGNINKVVNSSIGYLYVEVIASKDTIEKFIEFLITKKVVVKEM